MDFGRNNLYDYTITATDAAGNQTSQASSLTILDLNERPVNLIHNGSLPGIGWTIDSPKHYFEIAVNSPLSAGLFAESTTPANNAGSLNVYDNNGKLGNDISGIDENTFLLKSGQSYDFSIDLTGKTAEVNPNAATASWAIISASSNTVMQVIPGSKFTTGGIGADPTVSVVSSWVTIQTGFVSNSPTGNYRLALVWQTIDASSGDMFFDRIYLGEHFANPLRTALSSVGDLDPNMNTEVIHSAKNAEATDVGRYQDTTPSPFSLEQSQWHAVI